MIGEVIQGSEENQKEPSDKNLVHDHQNLIKINGFGQLNNVTELEISSIVDYVVSSKNSSESDGDNRLNNLKTYFSSWQISQLQAIKDSKSGIRCLLNSWLVSQKDFPEGTYCNGTWDNVYCWPPVALGATVNQTCTDAFMETLPLYAPQLEGHGYKVCLTNGTWLHENWTNYTECANSFDVLFDATVNQIKENQLVTIVQYILSIGSLLSLICLLLAVMTFHYFRVLKCERVTIHVHLMISLILRYVMLLNITGPFMFKPVAYYRSIDLLCKGFLIIYLYATLSSTSWMFIEGIYINGKLTTSVYFEQAPLKLYYITGWLLPLVLTTIWGTVMYFTHDVHCWLGYAEINQIWIIIGPIIFALVVNFLLFINILRILLKKMPPSYQNSDILKFRSAAKATIVLFPLLGLSNLLFLYNPGGVLDKYYVILNALFGSTQGIFVATLYCLLTKDVRAAYRRLYRRFMSRRNANAIRLHAISQSAKRPAASARIVEQPVNIRENRLTSLQQSSDSSGESNYQPTSQYYTCHCQLNQSIPFSPPENSSDYSFKSAVTHLSSDPSDDPKNGEISPFSFTKLSGNKSESLRN